jgi:uncharacterized protein
MNDEATALIDALGLQPHPEGGWFAETWGAPAEADDRPAGTAIYFLLREGEASHWHRVDAVEIWHHYAGSPLDLRVAGSDDGPVEAHRLGPDVLRGEQPQVVVPAGAWQAARSLGGWTLVGCTVVPGFSFDGFQLAPPEWEPGV